MKYGKLLNGFVLKLDSNFIRRMRNHIMYFYEDCTPIGVIIGTNGYVWIYSPTQNQLSKSQDVQVPVLKQVSAQEREKMAVLRNTMLCLQQEQLPIFKDTIQQVIDKYESLKEVVGSAKNMVNSRQLVTESARELIEKEI